MQYIFLLGRILLGGYFIMNGFNHFKNLNMLAGYAGSKGLPMPKLAVMGTGLMLLIGGAGILLGGWIKLSVILIGVFLFVTSFKMHQYWAVSDPMSRMNERINFTKNMGLLGAVLMLLMIPLPWVMSLVN